MIEFLLQYGLFLAKTLTLVVAFIVIVATLISLSLKAKNEDGTLIISSVNEKINDIRQSFQSETLPKEEWKKWQKAQKQEAKDKKKNQKNQNNGYPRLFVLRFDGDMRASQVTGLRESISAILDIATDLDEVLVVLESAGGFVHGYGLAASQLHRLRARNLNLTVAIDKVAASGGYLMACVAHKIIAAPFAIIGSIGVVAQIPNFHKLLTKNHVDFELHTAGEFKRTLTMFGENTEKARKKFQEELEETHLLFKQFITNNRPQVDIDKVATGEHWHAIDAIKLNLIDEILTSDDLILNKAQNIPVFEISYEEKQKFSEKLTSSFMLGVERLILKLSILNPFTLR